MMARPESLVQRDKGKERTLTAFRSPFQQVDEASIAVLFAAGRASGVLAQAGPRRFVVLGDQLVLGRRSAGEVAQSQSQPGGEQRWSLEDPLVSGQHARLLRTGDGMTLEDLGSQERHLPGWRPGDRTAGVARGGRVFRW